MEHDISNNVACNGHYLTHLVNLVGTLIALRFTGCVINLKTRLNYNVINKPATLDLILSIVSDINENTFVSKYHTWHQNLGS